MTKKRSFCNRIIEAVKKREKIPKRDTFQFLLMWAVKIIFIPLMYFWLITTTTILLNFNWTLSPEKLASGLFVTGLSIDLLIGTSGYLLSSKIFKSEIISTDTYWLGWLSCLICYPPLLYFLQLASTQTDNTTWSNYFDPSQPVYWVWATILSCSWIAYWASTLSFGIRFSNLSWRGLVDTGLYKYTKHPAYISKNLYWWMYTIPFIGAETWLETTRNILGMTTLSLIYLLRAKTEERHLLQFKEYQEYSKEIEAKGAISKIKKITRSILKCLRK
jgi:protein-S-isoprenylcysteine O-methyltransferase Ste14